MPDLIEIQITPSLPGVELPSGSNSISSVDLTKDYAGNRFDVYLQSEGNDTAIHIVKRNPQGEVVAEAVALPDMGPDGRPRKLNSAAAKVSGADVIVVATGYDLTSPTRINYPMSCIWEGAATPYPQGMNPEMGGGAVVFPQDGEQKFADVPPDHPLYSFIQYMSGVHAVSGYPCGGPGEPCDAQNRPYFRPGNSATRGQLCKMIALAVGFTP